MVPVPQPVFLPWLQPGGLLAELAALAVPAVPDRFLSPGGVVPLPQPVLLPWLQPGGVLPVLVALMPLPPPLGRAKAGMVRPTARRIAAAATDEVLFT